MDYALVVLKQFCLVLVIIASQNKQEEKMIDNQSVLNEETCEHCGSAQCSPEGNQNLRCWRSLDEDVPDSGDYDWLADEDDLDPDWDC